MYFLIRTQEGRVQYYYGNNVYRIGEWEDPQGKIPMLFDSWREADFKVYSEGKKDPSWNYEVEYFSR